MDWRFTGRRWLRGTDEEGEGAAPVTVRRGVGGGADPISTPAM